MLSNVVKQEREDILKLWVKMWLQKRNLGIEKIFSPDAHYIENWGPEYYSALEIAYWFDEWNRRGSVIKWNINQFIHDDKQTVVQWGFVDKMKNGKTGSFDGMTLVHWNANNQIDRLQEYGCKNVRYDPYKDSASPRYKSENADWFTSKVDQHNR